MLSTKAVQKKSKLIYALRLVKGCTKNIFWPYLRLLAIMGNSGSLLFL